MADVASKAQTRTTEERRFTIERLSNALTLIFKNNWSVVHAHIKSEFDTDSELRREYEAYHDILPPNDLDIYENADTIVDDSSREKYLEEFSQVNPKTSEDQVFHRIAQRQQERTEKIGDLKAFQSSQRAAEALIDELNEFYKDPEFENSLDRTDFNQQIALLTAARTTPNIKDIWIAYPRLIRRVERLLWIVEENTNEAIDRNLRRISYNSEQEREAEYQKRKEELTKAKETTASIVGVNILSKTQPSSNSDPRGENSNTFHEQELQVVKANSKAVATQLGIVRSALENFNPKAPPRDWDYTGDSLEDLLIRQYKIDPKIISDPYLAKEFAELEALFQKNVIASRLFKNDREEKRPSSDIPQYETFSDLMKNGSFQIENRELLQRVDAAAFAIQVATLGNHSSAQTLQIIDHAIQVLAQSNPSFAKSLSSEMFRQSIKAELLSRVQFIKAKSLVLSGKLLGLNSNIQATGTGAFDKMYALTFNMGGSEAALAAFSLTKPQLIEYSKKIETYSKPFSNVLSTNAAAEEHDFAPDQNSIREKYLSAESMLWVEATLAASGKKALMSREAFIAMASQTGKRNTTDEKYLGLLYDSIQKETSNGVSYRQRVEIVVGVQESQSKLAQFVQVDPSAEAIDSSYFVTYESNADEFEDEDGSILHNLLFGETEALDEMNSTDPDLAPSQNRFGLPNLRGINKKKKQAEAVSTVANSAKAFTNPALLASAGVLGGAGIFVAGLASQAPALMGAGGALAGASAGAVSGALIGVNFFGIGAIPGAVIGGLIGGASGGAGAYLYGQNLFPSISSQVADGSRIVSQIGQAGVNAALRVGPSTAVNAATAAKGIGGRVGQIGAKGASGAINAATKGLSALTSGGIVPGAGVTTTIVGGTLAVGVGASLFVMLTTTGAFITPGEIPCFETSEIQICKTATPNTSANPTSVQPVKVTYTIVITAKENKTVTITSARDVFTFQKNSTGDKPPEVVAPESELAKATNKTVSPSSPLTLTYDINFDSLYADTRVINAFTAEYTYSGGKGALTATAAVTFGAVATGGCWPTNGTVTQLQLTGTSHQTEDAIDIGASRGEPVYTPFAGEAHFFNETPVNDPENPNRYPIVAWGANTAGYGTYVFVKADNGYTFFYAHLSKMTQPPGTVQRVGAGEQIGEVGNSGNSTGPHLHYELKTSSGNPVGTSLLAQFIPYQPKVNDTVSTNQCANLSNAGAPKATVGCFSFIDGTKQWSESELALAMPVLRSVLGDKNRNAAICTKSPSIELRRLEGAPFDAGGKWGAEVMSSKLIYIYDTVFNEPQVFGASTFWHEPGHIIQLNYPGIWSSNFQNVGRSSYIPTYPYNQTDDYKRYSEDFAEAFGMCSKSGYPTVVSPGFRDNPTIRSTDYPAQCAAVKNVLSIIGGQP